MLRCPINVRFGKVSVRFCYSASMSAVYESFVQVVEQGSVSAAARVLGVPRPTVSRRLARLEERLGERLVRRTGREVTITRAGHLLYQRVRAPLDALATAEREFVDRQDAPRGLVRVSIPPLLALAVAPLVLALRTRFPDIALDVVGATRFVDLVGEGFDVAVRAGVLSDSDLVQRRLGWMRAGLWAAPAYLADRGTPQTVEDLAAHTLLRGRDQNDAPRTWWPLRGGGRVPVDGAFCTNDRALLRAVCSGGGGIALLAEIPPLDPSLIPVLPEVGARVGLHVVYAERALLPPRVRVVIDAIMRAFATR